jgi:hypothetical protein
VIELLFMLAIVGLGFELFVLGVVGGCVVGVGG